LACSLGNWRGSNAATALAKLAVSNPDDPYVLAGVWSSLSADNLDEVVRALFVERNVDDLPLHLVESAVKVIAAMGRPQELTTISAAISQPASGGPHNRFALAALLLQGGSPTIARVASLEQQLAPLIAAARDALSNSETAPRIRKDALELLFASTPTDDRLDFVAPYVGPQYPPQVQQQAVRLLASLSDARAVDVAVAAWPGFSPGARSTAFGVLSSRPAHAVKLLEQIAAGNVPQASIDAAYRQRLLTHVDAMVRERAAATFADSANPDRARLVAEYLGQIKSPGDPEQGRQVFRRHCVACHRLEGEGTEVGPDLAALSNRTAAALVESILDPNRAVDDRYRSYVALTVDGLGYSGILQAETANSVTLVDQQGKPQVLLRADLETFANTGVSLMPEGLERSLTPNDVADLTAYLGRFQPSASGDSASSAATRRYRSQAARAIADLATQIADGVKQEYDAIPMIWESAIAAGRRNDDQELAEVIDLAIPSVNASVADWQFVALGGGVVNGLSEVGATPTLRVRVLFELSGRSAAEWNAVLEQAVACADATSVPMGTRYDAVRLLAVANWETHARHAVKYLTPDFDPELQLGAAQTLADHPSPQAVHHLFAALSRLSPPIQRQVVASLLRTSDRAQLLAAAIADGNVDRQSLTAEEQDRLQTLVQGDVKNPAPVASPQP
ncbi:MAG: c-type cytochrome, partial [Planctomycetales bacterium]|nr:c-type cytochrome [Planctomycetales bacterium]